MIKQDPALAGNLIPDLEQALGMVDHGEVRGNPSQVAREALQTATDIINAQARNLTLNGEESSVPQDGVLGSSDASQKVEQTAVPLDQPTETS